MIVETPMSTTEVYLAVFFLAVYPARVGCADGQAAANKTRRELRYDEGHTGTIHALDLSGDGNTVASGDTNGSVLLWDVQTGTIKHRFSHPRRLVTSVAFSPDGRTLAVGLHPADAVILRDVATGKVLRLIATDCSPSRVAFSPDGTTLAVGLGVNLTYLFFDVKTWKIKCGPCWYYGVGLSPDRLPFRFSRDGQHFAGIHAGRRGKTVAVALWDMRKKKPQIISLETEQVADMAFSPDGEYLAWAEQQDVHVWDVRAKRRMLTLENTAASCVAFTPDGRYLAVGKKLHPLASKHPPLELPINPRHFVFSDDGRVVVVAPRNGCTLLILDAKNMKKGRE
jgi:WD40 repeat protein